MATGEDLRPASVPAPAPHRGRNLLLGLAAALLVLLLAAVAVGSWLWTSEAGTRQLLGHVPGLQAQGVSGRLGGGPFGVQRLAWRSAGGLQVVIEDLSWRDATWHWRPYPGAWIGLRLAQPQARRVQVDTAPKPAAPDTRPLQPPADLRLPLELQADGLALGTLQIDRQAPITALHADLHLGAQQGALHRVDGLRLARGPLQLSGDVRIGSAPALPVDARLALRMPQAAATPSAGASAPAPAASAAAPLWQAELGVQGPLRQLALQARVATDTHPVATASASLTPFAPFPLAAFQAQIDGLDLAVLDPALPQTRLAGRATLTEAAAGRPLKVEIALDNAVAGTWDTRRVPVRSLHAVLQAQPDRLDALGLDSVDLALGGDEPGGRLSGSGRWQDGALTLDLSLSELRPSRLDGRAPVMAVDGPVTLSLTGLGGATPAPSLRGTLHADLAGRLLRSGTPPVRLQADARLDRSADTLQVSLGKTQLRAGDAGATLTADARRGADGAWRVETQGELSRFDPGVWWPGIAGRGGSALNGGWQATMTLPAQAPQGLLAALRGQARLKLADSRLAGLPIAGQATLKADDRDQQVDAALRVGPNHLSLAGGLQAKHPRWTFDIDAPDLATLAPLKALLPGAAPWFPKAGRVALKGSAQGAWPALRSDGMLHLAGYQSEALQLRQADARWAFGGTGADAPLALHVTAQDLAQGQRRLDRLQLDLDGTPRAHTLALQATTPLRPPAWTEAIATPAGAAIASSPGGSRFELNGRGGWQPAPRDAGGTWQGTLALLQAAPRGRPGEPWLLARDLQASVQLSGALQPLQARLAPGRIALFGGALVWQQASWQVPATAGAPPRVFLDARVEPLQVAPWLAKLQPQFGWQGDLALGGHLKVDTTRGIDADIAIERAGDGDLKLTIEGATRALGLRQLRLALAAHGGAWELTQAISGENIGVISGTQTVRTGAGVLLPAGDAPLQGSLGLVVPKLAVWAPWLPPGWRLGGSLQAGAVFSGTAGAPQLSGEVHGSEMAVRNLFQGVNLRDGTLAIRIVGEQLTIDRFEFRGGSDGVLRITGGASFSDAPQAHLRVSMDHFRALDRIDRRIALSGEAALDLAGQAIALNGNFKVDSGQIDISQSGAPSLDDDIVVVNRPGAERPGAGSGPAPAAGPGPQSPPGLLARADVKLRIDLGQDLHLHGRGLDAALRGQLRVSTPGGELAVDGTIRVVDGTYRAYGQNLQIQRGTLTFTGEVANPRLDVLALRPDIDTRVGVIVSGLASNPRVRLYSEPSLPEFDTLTWLVLGRAPEGLGRDDTALLQRAALALLAGDSGSAGEGLIGRLGLDELSVRRGEAGDAGNTIVSLGKQISKRVFVGYEHALSGAGGTWQLIYRVAQRFTLRARAGDDNAIDAIWTWRWN